MVAVSACLLGLNCRYEGDHRRSVDTQEILNRLQCKNVVPFCPEVNILGAPREPIDLFRFHDRIEAVGRESKRVYTKKIELEAERFKKSFDSVNLFIFKSKSPSCALCSAKVYTPEGAVMEKRASGIFAKKMKIWYKDAKFMEI